MFALIIKELKSYFQSPVIYILAALYSLLAGILFYSLLLHYARDVQNSLNETTASGSLNLVTQYLIFPLFGNLNFLLMVLIPALMMGSWTDEYRKHTIYLYQLSRFSPWSVVMSKYIAGVITCSFFLISVLFLPGLLWHSGIYEFSFLWTGLLGLFFNLMLFVAISTWASSLSTHPMMAMFLSYFIIMVFWLVAWPAQFTDQYIVTEICQYLAQPTHFEAIAKGDVSTADFLYYFLVITFFAYLTRQEWRLRVMAL